MLLLLKSGIKVDTMALRFDYWLPASSSYSTSYT